MRFLRVSVLGSCTWSDRFLSAVHFEEALLRWLACSEEQHFLMRDLTFVLSYNVIFFITTSKLLWSIV